MNLEQQLQILSAISSASDFDQLKDALASVLSGTPGAENTTDDEPDLLTIREACDYLGRISKPTFYELATRPGFPAAYRMNARVVRYEKKALREWLETTKH